MKQMQLIELYQIEKELRLAAEARIEVLEAENKALKEVVKLLIAKVEELEKQIKPKKNSRNSSKPPSTDGYEKPNVKNTRPVLEPQFIVVNS